MPDMDVDPPDRQTLCSKRDELYSTIETSGILIENFNEVINVPDTPQNHQMKEIVQKQIREHQQGKDAALAELDTIPPYKVDREPCADSNISDLIQVFELVQVISRILKRSPEILTLLPKLKQAERDNNAAYVLIEALLDKN
ncbi:hypothetical protein TNCT_40081 [Trichonephila clavata]|uniref:Uncharacterized protein n=1 Tax=Trichonephila clavata TaxID=2740835 RepID=A0A8X6JKV2_TRICU|nr:hypothetical protein TNCT_40081 [Trichonephila clavata]